MLAYLDCFSGISGDMLLGALLDAGADVAELRAGLAALPLTGYQLDVREVQRQGLRGLAVRVVLDETTEPPLPAERRLADVTAIVEAGGRPQRAQERALTIFQRLAAAEARVHGVGMDEVHFHEVGAVDAMVDIVCAAVGCEALGVDEIVCSPLNVGGGTVECAHGRLPIPAPAALELLKGAPVYSSGMEAELVTPTGAAIVSVLAPRFAAFPAMRVEKIGYGAGTCDFPRHANVLRLSVGETVTVEQNRPGGAAATVTVLEANLDDMNPQVFGYVMERLLQEGALDVFAVPVQMKKNRPGTLLTVLARPADAARLTEILFAETTTIGVRSRVESRECLERRWEAVSTPWGEVRMKIASRNGVVTNYAPEFEDCRRIAESHGVPLKQVMAEAIGSYSLSEVRR